MNLIYYIFFVVYFFLISNQVDSRLSHIKVTYKNGAKIYTVGGKQFKTFRNAHSYNKKRSRLLKRKPNRRPARRLTRKNTRRQTNRIINRIINRRPTSRSNRFPIVIPKPQPTQPPIIATTASKAVEIAEKIQTYYKEINEHREKHKVKSLKVSEELVERAQKCAKDKGEPKLVDPKVVRNVARFNNIVDNPVDFWYSQKGNHNFDDPEYKQTSEEFIHMLWKSATDIGCAMIHDKEYWLCCYFSPVEKVTEKKEIKENVLKE